MPASTGPFEIDDTKSFDANLSTFLDALAADDRALADVLKTQLPRLLKGETTSSAIWNALSTAATASAES
jgi:hypothetical protein